jgi:hypothetical protein
VKIISFGIYLKGGFRIIETKVIYKYVSSPEGNLLAHGTTTMMIVPDLKVEGQENLLRKLI